MKPLVVSLLRFLCEQYEYTRQIKRGSYLQIAGIPIRFCKQISTYAIFSPLENDLGNGLSSTRNIADIKNNRPFIEFTG